MNYPSYPSQPFTGALPTMYQAGPSDLRYTSDTAPRFQAAIDRSHGRYLAGLGAAVQDEDAVPGTATNELALLAQADDIRGDGVFDPPGAKRQVYSDAGVFSARYSFPGYLARERSYAESEVVDATTGRPVVFVNGGAVSMDSAAQVAFLERGLYQEPAPIQAASAVKDLRDRSTVNVRVNPQPIDGIGQETGTSKAVWWAGAGLVGLAIGVTVAITRRKGKRK